MRERFEYAGFPSKIVFGAGRRHEAGDWIARAGHRRALVLSTPQQEADATALATELGPLAAGVFAGAAMHTPVEVTDRAVSFAAERDADCVVSLGGGSTTGLGKAIALRTDLDQIVIPTTYAGSEVTDILGQTENRQKTTLRNPAVRPEIVIYDPELTTGLPVAMSITSGLNAIAHAVEALYAHDGNPIVTLMATEGMRALHEALPAIVDEPTGLQARSRALYGAWLCGIVLGSAAMALHHKLCHTLGGSFDLPHAETHAVVLPHAAGFNAVAVPQLMTPVAEIFGTPPGAGLFDFSTSLGAPNSLRSLGMRAEDLDEAARRASANPYENPRAFDEKAIRALLQQAWEGTRPEN